MSKRRVVEYFVVAGVKKSQSIPPKTFETSGTGAQYLSSPLSPLSPLSEHVSRGKESILPCSSGW